MNLLAKLKTKKIILAPHSPTTLALNAFLLENNIQTLGFIDKNKMDANIYKANDLQRLDFDYVLILSPNHFEVIAEEYLSIIKKNKIVKVVIDYESGNYKFTNDFEINQRRFFYQPKEIEAKRTKMVFISKDFIGSNNKFLYLQAVNNGLDTIILTDNQQQILELKKHNLPCELLNTKEADYQIATAKYLIFDQGNYTYLPELHPEQKTIQLWHGVGLKKMSKINHIKYDYFVSTSDWTNQTNFRNIFIANNFLNLGYPRNDILFQQETEQDLLFCDKKVYQKINNSNKKVILYMPTHRENRQGLNLDLTQLNKKLQEIDAIFVIKMHPFVLELYKNKPKEIFSNILFHNANSDIYPLLKHIDILVSDYSSIVYDFLLLDKPIIFYIYDLDEYQKNYDFLFDFNSCSPGVKVVNQQELEDAFSQQDSFQEQRKEIKNLFFDQIAQKECANNILKELIK